MDPDLAAVYDTLSARFGSTGWWPGDTPFEVAVGAILTQNTSWTQVEKAIDNLKAADLLDPKAILNTGDDTLHTALRPSGYFRLKTKRLQAFCAVLVDEFQADMAALAKLPLDDLRARLLNIYGIGPETADDIILYACHKPVFVVDAYTRRIFSRHGWVDESIKYEALRAFCESRLPRDVRLFKDYHGLIVMTAKDFCRKRPNCDGCPLEPFLPAPKT